jgi:hypothetical protein
MQVTSGSVADVDVLVPSWRPSLEAENKSPATLTSYTYATAQLSAFLRERGMPTDGGAIAREHVEAFLVHVRDTRSPSTQRPATAASGSSSPGARLLSATTVSGS